MANKEMPKYECHKTVHALQIKEVLDTSEKGAESDGGRTLVFVDTEFAVQRVTSEYVRKHSPQPGGYYVIYKDGYESFSPAEAFESGYTLID